VAQRSPAPFDDPAALTAPREPGRKLGLVGMRERTELVGGEFTIESAPGEGTTVTAVLPPATISVQQDVGAGN
jgi:signal transduction histidine kinase